MQGLLDELRDCRDAAGQAQDSEKKQELRDRVVDATSAVLGCRASLPLSVARSILSDNQARRLRDHALCVGDKCNAKGSSTISSLEAHRNRAAKVFTLLQSNATRDQLSQAASTVATHYAACMEWWQKKARRCEMMRSVCAATANLPGATAEMRQVEQAALRLRAGWALNTKFMHLQSRIALARVTIEPQASTFEARAGKFSLVRTSKCVCWEPSWATSFRHSSRRATLFCAAMGAHSTHITALFWKESWGGFRILRRPCSTFGPN
ncbi:hypothetical protein BQ8794_180081 [Mesorhizobium prunaredense]|uniref:Uncharacterized protein n=2 Tax=Mesorhizobium prunaredense TaxID=1631249 RepID=A0A1R3V4D8_9HYPH|nr:hypothetical protein BQ8794_180081 [Mesorhizobium prunaredense]